MVKNNNLILVFQNKKKKEHKNKNKKKNDTKYQTSNYRIKTNNEEYQIILSKRAQAQK